MDKIREKLSSFGLDLQEFHDLYFVYKGKDILISFREKKALSIWMDEFEYLINRNVFASYEQIADLAFENYKIKILNHLEGKNCCGF